jgi:hypothetical protein
MTANFAATYPATTANVVASRPDMTAGLVATYPDMTANLVRGSTRGDLVELTVRQLYRIFSIRYADGRQQRRRGRQTKNCVHGHLRPILREPRPGANSTIRLALDQKSG